MKLGFIFYFVETEKRVKQKVQMDQLKNLYDILFVL